MTKNNFTLDDVTDGGLFCDGDWIEKKDQDENGNIRLIQLADIGDGTFIDKSRKFINEETARRLNCTFLKKGDILISRLGVPLGKACIFPYEGKFITAVDIAILRIVNPEINTKFIMYLINSFAFRAEIASYQSGTTRKRISRKNLAKIRFSLPSLSEQERIVEKIEELFSRLDNAVDTLNAVKAQLEVYKQAVLRESFFGNYPEKPLCEISRTISGYAFKSSKYTPNGKYTVIKIGNVKDRRFDFSRDHTLTNEVNDTILEKYLMKKGDCLITLTGSRGKRDYGFVTMIDKQTNYLLNQRVAALRFDENYALPEFYQYYLSSPDYRDKFFSYETGNVGQGNVGVKALSEPAVICPTKDEQRAIITNIETRLSMCEQIENTVIMSLAQASAMRQSILKQAFEGRLL